MSAGSSWIFQRSEGSCRIQQTSHTGSSGCESSRKVSLQCQSHNHTLLSLHSSTNVSTDQPTDQLPELTRELLTTLGAALVPDVVELDYDSWTACESAVVLRFCLVGSGHISHRGAADILNSILPNEGLDDAPSSFTQTGHIGELSSSTSAHPHTSTPTHLRRATLIWAISRPCESQGRMAALQTPHRPGHP